MIDLICYFPDLLNLSLLIFFIFLCMSKNKQNLEQKTQYQVSNALNIKLSACFLTSLLHSVL